MRVVIGRIPYYEMTPHPPPAPGTGRVGFFCTSPSRGGLELNVLKLAGWLRSGGTSVVLLLREGTALHRDAVSAGAEVGTVGPHRKYFDIGAARRLRDLLRRLGVSTLFVSHRDDMDVAAWVKFLAGPQLSLVFQQHMQLGVSRRDPVHSLRYSRYDAWISPLEGLRDEVLAKTRIPPEKIHVIPLGIDAGFYSTNPPPGGTAAVGAPLAAGLSGGIDRSAARNFFGIPPGGTLFGIMGRIEPGKGQGFLVRAVKRLRDSGHDARLLIVGDATIEPGSGGGGGRPDYREQLREAVRETGLSGVVWLHPFLEDPRNFFRAVDACVMATESETYGMVTLEAMASGTPVIGTNSGGTPEILDGGRCGLLFRPLDEGDFVRAAGTVIRGEYPVEMVAAAAARVRERFSHERQCAMILELIGTLRRGG